MATMKSLARQTVPGDARGRGLGREVSVYGQSVKYSGGLPLRKYLRFN